MKIKRIELNNFKRFTNLVIEDLPETTKLVVLVGPNGSGKTSFLEGMNYYNNLLGFGSTSDKKYLIKEVDDNTINWNDYIHKAVKIEFFDASFDRNNNSTKGHFYFRSAYRNEPDFKIYSIEKQDNPREKMNLSSLIQDDKTVSSNYQRLFSYTVSELYNEKNDNMIVKDLRERLVKIFSNSIKNIFEDLEFSSLGNPLENGDFYFKKGGLKNFSYCNLSAGEKSAFDLILDIVVKSQYYQDAVYCIDEPEAHMHTSLQGRVLRELFSLLPEKSQMWIATHSIGMLREAEEIEKNYPGTVVFLDFGDRDFDIEQTIRPSKRNKALINKFYELAFGDFAKLILPQIIIFCEGDENGNNRKGFDRTIYTTIFENLHPEAIFISGGSCSQIENLEETHGAIIQSLLANTKIIKIIDHDDRSEREVCELSRCNVKVLKRRNLEGYLLDDSMIKKLCESLGKIEMYDSCLIEKQKAISSLSGNEHPNDDLKKVRGFIYNSLKKILGLTRCGNNADSFLRDTLAPLMTPDMDIYKELEQEIFY